MYSAVLPSYHSKEKESNGKEVINADDPQNKDKIKELLFS
jgi:hypothetical protein